MSTQELRNAAAVRRKKANPYSLSNALRYGGPIAWLSCIIMGLGNFCAGQIIKGLIFLAMEAAVIWFMFTSGGGLHWLSMISTLGDREDGKVWNDVTGVYDYTQGDRSQQILLYAVATIAILVMLIVFWRASVRSGYQAMCTRRAKKHVPNFWEDIKALFDGSIHKLLMSVPFMCLVVFTIVPLVYMMAMAFTNYDKDHLLLFDWVGLQNFASVFNAKSTIGSQFWSVLGWTLIWAFFATFLNFFFGTFMAMIIDRKTTRLKGLWRGILSLTIAVPQFVSLLIIRSMFKQDGAVNTLLQNIGVLDKAAGEVLPFLTNANWARVLLIVINLWVGIPYTVMQVTGILKNIPAEQYEAARIDGANVAQQFIHITLPYMIFVMTPYIITQFTGNINNFNIIYLLTGGGPTDVGASAGKTDLLVTWLYKLSVDKQQYNLGAVIGIFTFIVLAIVALVTYRSSGSYKDEEGFK